MTVLQKYVNNLNISCLKNFHLGHCQEFLRTVKNNYFQDEQQLNSSNVERIFIRRKNFYYI